MTLLNKRDSPQRHHSCWHCPAMFTCTSMLAGHLRTERARRQRRHLRSKQRRVVKRFRGRSVCTCRARAQCPGWLGKCRLLILSPSPGCTSPYPSAPAHWGPLHVSLGICVWGTLRAFSLFLVNHTAATVLRELLVKRPLVRALLLQLTGSRIYTINVCHPLLWWVLPVFPNW